MLLLSSRPQKHWLTSVFKAITGPHVQQHYFMHLHVLSDITAGTNPWPIGTRGDFNPHLVPE